ncbi:MAG: hypothetical protein UZ11_BCD004000440 [Bacteroidetes bacterium OLB11]|nr:MAG: hypothetical protein UZ11_BCD004000440 [Bacteroidetes bacterium OLB11]
MVINKFLTLEGRINVLIDIILNIEVDKSQLNKDVVAFYDQIMNYNQL